MNSKTEYILHLADNGLILSQRLGEWCGHGPILEQDIALTNIALDLLGQARYFYQYATETDGQGKSEDFFPYFRNEREFKNLLLVEQLNGDWAHTMMRQFFYDNFMQLVYSKLLSSTDKQIAAIASKAIKEVNYHLKFSSEWIIRMGDGTEESHYRVQEAANNLWEFTGELFIPTVYETKMAELDIAPNPEYLKNEWSIRVDEIFIEATLNVPCAKWYQTGGKTGTHSENLGLMLTDLQYLQRTYPGNSW